MLRFEASTLVVTKAERSGVPSTWKYYVLRREAYGSMRGIALEQAGQRAHAGAIAAFGLLGLAARKDMTLITARFSASAMSTSSQIRHCICGRLPLGRSTRSSELARLTSGASAPTEPARATAPIGRAAFARSAD